MFLGGAIFLPKAENFTKNIVIYRFFDNFGPNY